MNSILYYLYKFNVKTNVKANVKTNVKANIESYKLDFRTFLQLFFVILL